MYVDVDVTMRICRVRGRRSVDVHSNFQFVPDLISFTNQNSYKLISKNSVEEHMWRVAEKKRRLDEMVSSMCGSTGVVYLICNRFDVF